MLPFLRRATRLRNVYHALPVCCGITDGSLTSGSSRDLCGRGCQVSSQVLPFGYSESAIPIIQRFSTESLSSSNFYDEPSYGDGPMEATHKVNETRSNMAGSLSSAMVRNADPGSRYSVHRPDLFRTILDAPSFSVGRPILDKWIGDGNQLQRNEFLLVLFHLRKQRLYWKALQFIEWVERGKLLNFEEHDYACHLDMIARNSGIENARKYLERVPKSFRNEVMYETLLVNCVCISDVQKAEQVFKEIRNLTLPLTISACNQMILLYKRVARNKVADILMLMEKENIKPSPFTYKLLIDLKGWSNDMSGIELVLNDMKVSGVEPDFATWTMVAKFYIRGGLIEKAEAVITEMEANYIKDKRHVVRSLLHLYAALSKPDEVSRIWKLCTEPNIEDFLAAIEAWGKLGRIEHAEEIFEEMLNATPDLSSKYYNAMLNVYAENKLLSKGKILLERMSFDGRPSGPLTWHALIKLYVNSGEVGKADSFLLSVTEENPDQRPTYSSYIVLLMAYAKMGDIHNSEKIFDRLKKIGYPGRKPPYALLLEAYVKAEVPPHGFRERMKADDVHPIKKVVEHLKLLDKLGQGIRRTDHG